MTLVETTLLLPPNVVDVYMTDVDGDGLTGVNDLLEILSLFGASCD